MAFRSLPSGCPFYIDLMDGWKNSAWYFSWIFDRFCPLFLDWSRWSGWSSASRGANRLRAWTYSPGATRDQARSKPIPHWGSGSFPAVIFTLFVCRLVIHILFVLHAGFVLGLKRPEENKSGSSGSATRRHRVRRERRAVGSHPELQEKPKLQHPG